MYPTEFAVQLASASVDGRGADPRPEALTILRELRVLSSLRDADAPWNGDDPEAYLWIAISDDGFVLTLTAADTITRAVRIAELRERFEQAGLTLWLEDPSESVQDAADDTDDSDDTVYEPVDMPGVEEYAEAVPELSEEEIAALFQVTPVRVREFSHRGPVTARVLASMAQTEVSYAEDGDWSLMSYDTTETSTFWPPSKAEAPVISLNLTGGEHSWIEVTPGGARATTIPFWVTQERLTTPVLDIDAITVPAAAETYRMLLTEGDGSRDELEELATRCELDVEVAHAALIPEALGGVVGAEARIRSFLAAFGVPEGLIDAALSERGAPEGAEVFSAQGWGSMLADVAFGGVYETVAIPRRKGVLARLSKFLKDNPIVSYVITAAEGLGGAVLAAKGRGGWKAVGWLMVADAVIDVFVHVGRSRRR